MNQQTLCVVMYASYLQISSFAYLLVFRTFFYYSFVSFSSFLSYLFLHFFCIFFLLFFRIFFSTSTLLYISFCSSFIPFSTLLLYLFYSSFIYFSTFFFVFTDFHNLWSIFISILEGMTNVRKTCQHVPNAGLLNKSK